MADQQKPLNSDLTEKSNKEVQRVLADSDQS